MNAKHFLNQLQHKEIVDAIRKAEKRTSGEIRVFISRKPVELPVASAQTQFFKMGMEKTAERNAVLIFVAPKSHKFAIIADEAVHVRCGNDFWEKLSMEMTTHFRQGHFTQGIVYAISKAGELLGQHFPRKADDVNELADEVETD